MAEPEMTQPLAIVTLKVAAEGRQLDHWVAERPSKVIALIQDAKSGQGPNAPMVELTTIRGMKGSEFFTRFDNIASVEAYR